jgi:hypothetical protein
MVARIAGGAVAGWLLSLAPLIIINALSLNSGIVDPSSTALAGAGALALGIALGGVAAGLIGGRRGGAGAGAISGAIVTASLIAFKFALQAQNNLPNLVEQHPIRTYGALVFIGALVASVALVTAILTGRRATPADLIAPRDSAPRNQVSGIRQSGPAWSSGPQSGPMRRQSQPRPDQPELTPARRMDRAWASDPRRPRPGSGPRATAARRDERGHWPDAPGKW